MPKYVDAFVIPIKKSKLPAYKKMAEFGRKTWLKYGALDYVESVGDDLKVPWGLTFPKMCKLKRDETVIFAYVVYKSKRHRDQVNAKVHSDPKMLKEMAGTPMPFDAKRFAFGGFEVLVGGR